MAKKNYNWKQIYQDYLESGLSKKEFAALRHIGIANIYEHFKAYEGDNSSPEFRELNLISDTVHNVNISINKIPIEFPDDIKESQLITIVKAVVSC